MDRLDEFVIPIRGGCEPTTVRPGAWLDRQAYAELRRCLDELDEARARALIEARTYLLRPRRR